MRLLRRSTLATLLALAVLAAPASASVKVNVFDASPAALDGHDRFEISYGSRKRGGSLSEAFLWRRSISSGKRTKIATFKSEYLGVRLILAGGGRVAVGMSSLPSIPDGRIKTKILSFNRDGSGKRILASASTKIVNSPDPADRCGTTYQLISATETGSFVIARIDATRKGAYCGGSRDTDRWQYIEVAANGARRKIYSTDEKRSSDPDVAPPLVEVEVDGDYAALVVGKPLKVYMKNLVTGTTTGPFTDSVRKNGYKLSSIGVSVGSNGALAVLSDRKNAFTQLNPRWIDLFADPADPGTAVRSNGTYEPQFCGRRLVGTDYDQTINKSLIVELDPGTLAVSRRLAVLGGNSVWLESCTATEMVVSHAVESLTSLILRVIAIPG